MARGQPFGRTGRALCPNYLLRLAKAKQHAYSLNAREVRIAVKELETLRDLYPHVVAIEQELALAYIELSTLVKDERELLKSRSEAESILGRLLKELKPIDEETLGKMGRLHKEYAWAINRPGNRPGKEERVYYRHALELYEQAYRLRRHYYPGINVATLKLLLDDEKEARDVAKDVLETCYRATPADVVERNWIIATQGEAYLILKEFKLAIAHYRMAMSLDHDHAHAESPRRHARCILAKRPPENPAQKKEVLSALKVRSRS